MVTAPPESPALSSVQIGESPFFIAKSAEDRLAHKEYLTIDDLTDREWVLFERHVHPPLYELIFKLTEEKGVQATNIHHFVVAEEALPFIAQSGAVALLGKTGALRLTKTTSSRLPGGITIRPLLEAGLSLKSFMISRSDNDSKLASELLRPFMRKLTHFTEVKQLVLPIGLYKS